MYVCAGLDNAKDDRGLDAHIHLPLFELGKLAISFLLP
eukprot:COSAG05_NODE_20582_length_278_cov_0.821229_1_plen_37_part_01